MNATTMAVFLTAHSHAYYERLQRVETDFYEAYKTGEEALELFAASFQELLEDISTAPELDPNTAILANNVASRLRVISEGLHRIEVQHEKLTRETVEECDVICREYSASHSQYVPLQFKDYTYSYDDIRPIDSRNKQFEACYRWLINNLHNPYPSAKTKQSIADNSGAPLVNVENWFLRVRPRIGWSKLRKERFDNSNARMLAAAHQYFVEDKPSPSARSGPSSKPIQKPLAESLNLAFSEIEMTAKHMYKDRYHTSEEMIAATSKSKARTSHANKDARASRSKSRRSSTTGSSMAHRSSRSPSVTEFSSTTAPSGKRKRAREDTATELAKRSKYVTLVSSSSSILTLRTGVSCLYPWFHLDPLRRRRQKRSGSGQCQKSP
jgi:hypothetical protein